LLNGTTRGRRGGGRLVELGDVLGGLAATDTSVVRKRLRTAVPNCWMPARARKTNIGRIVRPDAREDPSHTPTPIRATAATTGVVQSGFLRRRHLGN